MGRKGERLQPLRRRILALGLVAFGLLTAGLCVTDAYRGQAPLVVLQGSERIFREVREVRSAVALRGSRSLYIVADGRSGVIFYDKGRKFSREIPAFSPSPDALAVDAKGQIYLADTEADRIVIVNPLGQLIRMFHAPRPLSLAVLSDGRIVVASPREGALLHLYDPSGRELKSFGALKLFDGVSRAQNRFLNRGRVLVDAADNIYYVFEFAPYPIVQKFSKEGELLSEFAIEGQAVDLQVQAARRFLAEKNPRQVGGIVTITSAAIDPVMGRLWIGTNGSSRSGIVYEYSLDGEKLREYAFVLGPTRHVIAGVEEIAVRWPWIYVFTSAGAYRFRADRDFVSDFHIPLEEQGLCPRAQEWPPCQTNCNTPAPDDDRDCRAALQQQISQAVRVIGSSCTTSEKDCYASVTTCDPTSGVQVVHTVILDCKVGGFLD